MRSDHLRKHSETHQKSREKAKDSDNKDCSTSEIGSPSMESVLLEDDHESDSDLIAGLESQEGGGLPESLEMSECVPPMHTN